MDRLTRDEGGRVGGEEGDDGGDFLRRAESAHRRPGDQRGAIPRHDRFGHRRRDDARRDAVGAHAARAEFMHQRACEGQHRRLARRVMRVVDRSAMPGHRGDVDDRPAIPQQQHRRAAGVENPVEIDGESLPPIRIGHRGDVLFDIQAGAGHQDVDAAEFAPGHGHGLVDLRRLGHVDAGGQDAPLTARQAGGEGLDRRGVEVREDQMRPELVEQRGGRARDAAIGAGDHGHFARKVEHGVSASRGGGAPSRRMRSRHGNIGRPARIAAPMVSRQPSA